MQELKDVKTKEDIINLAAKYSIQLKKVTKKELKEKIKNIKHKHVVVILRKHCEYNGQMVMKGDDGLYYTSQGELHVDYMRNCFAQ